MRSNKYLQLGSKNLIENTNFNRYKRRVQIANITFLLLSQVSRCLCLKKIHVVFGFVLNDNERLTVVCIFVFQNTEFKHIIFEYSILHWAEAYLLYLWDVIVPVSILKRKMEPILKLKIVCSSKKEGVEKLIYVYRRIH